MLIKILLLFYSIDLIFCKLFDGATYAVKKDKLFIYGGDNAYSIPSNDIYSIKLEGLKLKNQKIQWKLEKPIKDMPVMYNAKSFSISEKSKEILNFGGNTLFFVFNWLNPINYRLKNETKGLNGLMKILDRPDGFSKSDNFEYKFIQSDTEPSKFYLLNSLLYKKQGQDELKHFNILIYNASKNIWKDTKLFFYMESISIITIYKDLIYILNVPNAFYKSFHGYVINVEKSKIIKFTPKGDIPQMNWYYKYIVHENRLYYFASNKKNFIFNFYILDLDTLIWKKQNVNDIGVHTNPFIIHYKGYIIFIRGGLGYDSNYTQIFDTKTWSKVDGINKKRKKDSKFLTDQVTKNKDKGSNEQGNEKERIDKSALIGGLISGGIFIGLIIIFVYLYFKKRREASIIKPPEFITEHEVIDALNLKKENHLSFRFSIESNCSKINDNWGLKQPEAVYSINDDTNNILIKRK